MQSIIKDFLEKVTVDPPTTFWKFQGSLTSPSNIEQLAAELDVARLGLGGNKNKTTTEASTSSNQQKNLHQYVPLASTTLSKATGHTIFSQIQGALRHGGRPSLAAFQNLKGAEHCMNISSTNPVSMNNNNSRKESSSSKNRERKSHLESLAEEGTEDGKQQNEENEETEKKTTKEASSEVATTCSCQADSPALCQYCHESLRATLWKLYSLTTVLFSFRESCALLVSNNSKVSSLPQKEKEQIQQQLLLLLPSTYSVAEASKQARALATRVFLFARKLSHRWLNQQSSSSENQSSTTTSSNNRQHHYDTLKFFTAVFIEHSIQVALDVLAMLVTGFETESTLRYGSLQMDKLSSKQYKESCPFERKVVEYLLKLREVAVTTLSQSLLLTREALVSAFVFAKHCHTIVILFDDPFAFMRKQQQENNAGKKNNAMDDSEDDDNLDDVDDDEAMMNHFQSEEEVKALQTAQALIAERQERTLIQIELSSLKFASSVLTPPTVLDLQNIDEKGDHPSSFVASELCDANLETPNVYTGVQRQQISVSIINRVSSLLEHEEQQHQEIQREKVQSKIADPFGKIRQTGEEARRKEEIENQVRASQHRQTKLTEHYTIYAARFLLHIASHDLWVSFTKLPSKVRSNRIQQHNHQQMMIMMEKEQKKRNRGQNASSVGGGGTEMGDHDTLNATAAFVQLQQRSPGGAHLIVTSGVDHHQHLHSSSAPGNDSFFSPSSTIKSPTAIRSKSATLKSTASSAGGRNQNEETSHGTVILLPPRKSRVGSFFSHLTIDELEKFSTCLTNFATAFPVDDDATKTSSADTGYGKKEKKNQSEKPCALPMYGHLSAIDRKNVLACLIGIHWCLYKEEDFVPGAFAKFSQAKKLVGSLLGSPMSPSSMMSPNNNNQPQKSVGFASPNSDVDGDGNINNSLLFDNSNHGMMAITGGMSEERSRNLFPFSPSNQRSNHHQNQNHQTPIHQSPTQQSASQVNFSLEQRRSPTQSEAWQTGLFNLSTVSLSMGLSHFHSIGLSAHCASMGKHDPLATGLTMAQHRGVLHVPIGDDIFIDSGFMPVVKGRSSNIALEAPPCHPIDPQDFAPGLYPIDKRSTVSAVLNATLLAPPKEVALMSENNNNSNGDHHGLHSSSFISSNNKQNVSSATTTMMKTESPCEVTGMASLCTTTLIAVAAPKRQVARIPFSSVQVGSLHKNTANALNSKHNSDADESNNNEVIEESDHNNITNSGGEESKFFDETPPVFDPENTKATSHREQHLDLNRSMVVLNNARHLATIQLGIRSEIVGVLPSEAFTDQVADRSFSATGFIFTTASEGVRKTSMRPEWYRLGLFAAEHAEKQKRPPLHHPVVHADKTKEELEKQRQKQAEELFSGQLNDQPLTLAEKRKQRWTQEAALHARRAKLAEKKKRKSLLAAAASQSPDREETAQDRHQRALDQLEVADDRQKAAEEMINSGQAPDFIKPENALEEAHAVAARKCELLEEELEQTKKERDEAQTLVRDLRNQSDVVATCVIPPLQSEVRLLRHLLGQTLGALRAAESVAEKQNDQFKEMEKKLRKFTQHQQQQQQQSEEAAAAAADETPRNQSSANVRNPASPAFSL